MTQPSPEWKDYLIEELGRVVTGHTPLKSVKEYYESNDYTWIKPTDIRKGERYVPETEEYYSQKAFEKYKNSLLPPLATCVVTIGTVGEKICLTHKPCFTNQSINAIVPDRQKFDPMFVYYLLKNNLDQVAKRNPGTASGRHHVSKSNISSIIVKAPSKLTQSKISSILARYDDLLENNTRRIKILEEMAQAIYREWFINFRFPGHEGVRMVESELGPVPEGWEVVRLNTVAEINSDSIKRGQEPEEIGYIDISSVTTGTIDKIEWMKFSDSPGRARRIINHGDMIWSMVRPNRRSYCLIFDPEPNTIVSTGFAVVRGKKIPFTYLYHYLTTDDFVGYLTNCATGAAYPAVKTDDFENAEIIRPDDAVLKKFHEIIEPIYDMKFTLSQKNTNLRRTRDLLLPKIISGELDVSELDIRIPEAEA
jgi:type I restriction enzyme, S subunit